MDPLAATDPAAPPSHALATNFIQQYEIFRELGRGGMGVVYLARDRRLGRPVAIKQLTRPGHREERFLAEARATARCRHENIVVIHDVGIHAEQPYLVFEYLQGQTLRQWMDDRLGGTMELQDSSSSFGQIPAPLTATRAAEIMAPVVRALVCAHDMGITHRDLKPANIMLTDEGVTKVLDFGVAKIGAARERISGEDAGASGEPLALTALGARLGTLPYMSPEQLSGDTVDHRSDIWAVGIILYELVTGAHPLAPLSPVKIRLMADLVTPMPSVREHRGDLGPLADIISRCLLKDRDHRTGTARELLQELEALLPAQRPRAHHQESNPFAGLAAFQDADADRFFGRDHDIASMVGKLRSLPLVAVTGPSGAGKSSLVRAGVIPALRRSGEGWEAMVMRPGRQPLAALAEVLLALPGRAYERSTGRELAASVDHVPVERDAIVARLRREPGYLGTELRTWARARLRRLMLFVDQLEELYTLGADAAEQTCFLACVEAMADDAASPLRVLVAVRSSFLDRMVGHRGFFAAVHRGLELLSPLDRDGLREALTRPVEACGHGFESPAMVERILDELEAARTSLPLLQLTAKKLWARRNRQQRMLTAASLDKLAGLGGILASHADAILASMPAQDGRLARAAFLRLVTPERTRGQATVAELRQLGRDADAMDRVLARLIDACLLAVKASAPSSADGVESDTVVEIVHESLIHAWPLLRQWLEEARSGQSDELERFRVATRLYGREQEREAMLAALARVAGGGRELLLVTGQPGTGKSALVRELATRLAYGRGYFVEGKFDQYHNVPYSALASAFRALIEQLLTDPAARLAYWRQAMRIALGPNAQVLIEVIPELALLIGSQPPVPALAPTETEHRFHVVFQSFLEVLCSSQQPLIVFLDDLQWGDAASLRLMKLMMTDPAVHHLLFIGAYRDHEIDAAHPLAMILDQLRAEKLDVEHIALEPLGVDDVRQVLADTLQRSAEDCVELAELVVTRTAGNPFFVKQFLRTLHQDGLLVFDRGLGGWRWSLGAVQALGIPDNVVELMLERMRRLPAPTRRALEHAACVGNVFGIDILAVLGGASVVEIQSHLLPAIEMGLVQTLPAPAMRSGDADTVRGVGSHAFSHDRVQQAAYALLPEGERVTMHLRIARLFEREIPPEERDAHIFELAEHFCLGVPRIVDPDEQILVARLLLDAGRRARETLARESALRFLRTGLSLMPAESWDTCYELMRDLALTTVEAEYLNANFETALRLSEDILANARELLDKVLVYDLQILFHITQNQMGTAMELSLHVLTMLGFVLPREPEAAYEREQALRPQLALDEAGFAALEHLPTLTDPHQSAIIRILIRAGTPTFYVDPARWRLLALVTVERCMRHGHSSLSAMAYAQYGALLCGAYEDIERGQRFGDLAMRLIERFPDPELEVKVSNTFHVLVMPWCRPLREALEPLRALVRRGLEVGGLEFGLYCAVHYLFYQNILGSSLESVHREGLAYIALIERHHLAMHRDMIRPCERLTRDLLGLPMPPDEPGPPTYSPFFMQYEWYRQAMLNYIMGDYEAARTAAEQAPWDAAAALALLLLAEHFFVHSLAILATLPSERERDSERTRELLATIERNQGMFDRWAENVPANFRNQHTLVEAERARVRDDVRAAMDLYDRAIEGAREQGRKRDEALACERAANFYDSLGREQIANTYLQSAYQAYQAWGAQAKVRALEEQHPWLAERHAAAVLLRASQALSSELGLDDLLAELMRILIENTGAHRGYLLLAHDGGLTIEAEGHVDTGDYRALPSLALEAHDARLAQTVIEHVVQSKRSLLLQDAADREPFTHDPYLRAHDRRSLLCAPITPHGELAGIIYLEHDRAWHAFTPARVGLVQMLAAQAAIPIENARLQRRLAPGKPTDRPRE
jgi:predicted ATPase/serine/threonine protein kinase